MSIITLLTDSGGSDHYVASIKAAILRFNTGIKIIDISHEINSFDIAHGAFLLQSVFREFPKGTVHLVAVDAVGKSEDEYIAASIEDHFFVGVDNGLLSLVSDKKLQNIVQLHAVNTKLCSFPEKEILAPSAAKLANGLSISSLGNIKPHYKKMTSRKVKSHENEVVGSVIRIDHYGNIITNISRSDFEKRKEHRRFTLLIRGERFHQIHDNYNSVVEGECFLIFNTQSLLEIGINKGRASELFGISHDDTLHIEFES